jgi:hypothetical protein
MRKRTLGIVVGCLAAALIGGLHPTASAQVIDGGQVTSVEGDVVDAWEVVGNGLNITIGPRSCTLTAERPFRSANQVKGHGELSCNRDWELITLLVCVQVRQSAADDGGLTWQNVACQPLKQKEDDNFIQDTATASCVPQAAAYRTWVEGKGFRDDDDTEPAFIGTMTSDQAIFDC